MFTKLIGVLQSLFRALARRRHKETNRRETATGAAMTGAVEGSKVMATGFDMKAEIAKLSGRIMEPVTGKLTAEDMDNVVGRIRDSFEQLNAKRAIAETDFEVMAVTVLEAIKPKLSNPEFARVVDRLRGAMAGFCQSDRDKARATK